MRRQIILWIDRVTYRSRKVEKAMCHKADHRQTKGPLLPLHPIWSRSLARLLGRKTDCGIHQERPLLRITWSSCCSRRYWQSCCERVARKQSVLSSLCKRARKWYFSVLGALFSERQILTRVVSLFSSSHVLVSRQELYSESWWIPYSPHPHLFLSANLARLSWFLSDNWNKEIRYWS